LTVNFKTTYRLVDRTQEAIKGMKKAYDQSAERVANFVLEKASDNIVSKNLTDKGDLLGSGYVYRMGSGHYRVGFAAPHAPPIEFGSKPHFPPIAPLEAWVRRNLRVVNIVSATRGPLASFPVYKPKKKAGTSSLKRDAANSIAWAIAINIAKHGQRPKPFFRPALQDANFMWPGTFKEVLYANAPAEGLMG
jgi:hypothetical protein